MKTWRIELDVQTEDAVSLAEMQEVAGKIVDDATERIEDEIAGMSITLLGNVDEVST